jgi:hypothetical protein
MNKPWKFDFDRIEELGNQIRQHTKDENKLNLHEAMTDQQFEQLKTYLANTWQILIEVNKLVEAEQRRLDSNTSTN